MQSNSILCTLCNGTAIHNSQLKLLQPTMFWAQSWQGINKCILSSSVSLDFVHELISLQEMGYVDNMDWGSMDRPPDSPNGLADQMGRSSYHTYGDLVVQGKDCTCWMLVQESAVGFKTYSFYRRSFFLYSKKVQWYGWLMAPGNIFCPQDFPFT